MNRITQRMIYILTFLFSIVCLYNCSGNDGRIGVPTKIDLFYNVGGLQKEKENTSATVTLKEVTILPSSEYCLLSIDLTYENTGKRVANWDYSNAVITDSKGRIYEGKVSVNDNYSYGRKSSLVECEAGLSQDNYVFFKVPRQAFSDNIYFGFVSSIDLEKVQGKILVYDKSHSSFSFDEKASFKSSNW